MTPDKQEIMVGFVSATMIFLTLFVSGLFLLNDDPDGVLWLADGDADPPRIVFVPPGPEADQRRGAASDGRLPRRAGGGR